MKITIIAIDDWAALYGPDGKSFKQGHSIEDVDLFKLLQTVNAHPKDMEFITLYQEELSEWAEDHGALPDTLEECERIIKENKWK